MLTECSEPSIHPHPCPSIQAELSKLRSTHGAARGQLLCSPQLPASLRHCPWDSRTSSTGEGLPASPSTPGSESSCAHLSRNSIRILIPTTTALQGRPLAGQSWSWVSFCPLCRHTVSKDHSPLSFSDENPHFPLVTHLHHGSQGWELAVTKNARGSSYFIFLIPHLVG